MNDLTAVVCQEPEAISPARERPGADWADRLGIVVIGRNEGDRLVRCLHPVLGRGAPGGQVDSGSTDASVERARAAGAMVVALDASEPYTAARGRNAGFERLMRLDPGIEFVQFVDGDCQLEDGWMRHARDMLSRRPDVAAVC